MKTKRITVLILLLCAPALLSAEAEDKPILSVLNFESSGLSVSEVNLITDIITSHVQKTGAYRVVDRFQRKAIMDEIAFSRSGCVDESCQLEIGRLLSASFIITGSLGRVGSLYVINLRIITVETGETVQTETGSYSSIEALVESSQPIVFELLATEETPEEKTVDAPEEERTVEPEKTSRREEDIAGGRPYRHIFGIGAGFITAAVRRESGSSSYFSEFSSNLAAVRFTWLYRFGSLVSVGPWGCAAAGKQEGRGGYEEDDPTMLYGTIFTVAGGLSLALGNPVEGFSIILSSGILYYDDWGDVTVPISLYLSYRSVYAGYTPFMSPYVSPIFSTRYSWDEVEERGSHAVEAGYLFGR